jgi:hypothetical protein
MGDEGSQKFMKKPSTKPATKPEHPNPLIDGLMAGLRPDIKPRRTLVRSSDLNFLFVRLQQIEELVVATRRYLEQVQKFPDALRLKKPGSK